MPSFRMHLRAHGMVAMVFKTLDDSQHHQVRMDTACISLRFEDPWLLWMNWRSSIQYSLWDQWLRLRNLLWGERALAFQWHCLCASGFGSPFKKSHLGFVQKLTALDCCFLSSLKPLQIVLLLYLLFPSKREKFCKEFLLLVFKKWLEVLTCRCACVKYRPFCSCTGAIFVSSTCLLERVCNFSGRVPCVWQCSTTNLGKGTFNYLP